jgi:hypothetical protein
MAAPARRGDFGRLTDACTALRIVLVDDDENLAELLRVEHLWSRADANARE